MVKIRMKKLQTAQGMVEFALVLPLLLLLILGIFAFGHLFFVYSSVVSASREAARWGAAVGESPSSFPRYQDCANIRAQAVRLGSFAGVSANDLDPDNPNAAGIDIQFDHGPDPVTGEAQVYDDCRDGEGPSEVQMGDRVLVHVRVYYTPIVPVVNLPSFPLEATTFRTILRSVPVGEAPTAVDPCTTMTTITLESDPEPSFVGQPVTYHVKVTADDGTVVTGDVSLHDNEDPMFSCAGPLVDGSLSCISNPQQPVYWTVGDKPISIRYDSDNTCQVSSNTTDPGPDPIHQVVASPTQILLGVEPAVGQVGQSLTLNITVQSVTPGAGVPQGFVLVTTPISATPQRVDLTNGSGLLVVVPNQPGAFTFSVVYPDEPEDADPNYEGSTASITAPVYAATPTMIFTPTNTLPAITPTATSIPNYCPRLEPSNYDVFQVGSAIQLPILNPNVSGSVNQNISSVEITWPSDPAANLQEIRFGGTVDSCVTTGNGKNCLWQNTSGLSPTHQTVSSGTSGWNNSYSDINKGVSKFMRMVFNHAMPQGNYHVVIRFNQKNCQIDINRDKLTP